jgi:hypothetical protein
VRSGGSVQCKIRTLEQKLRSSLAREDQGQNALGITFLDQADDDCEYCTIRTAAEQLASQRPRYRSYGCGRLLLPGWER